MADEDERLLFDEPSDPDTLLIRDDSPVPEDFLEEKPSEPDDVQDVPNNQQAGDDLPWDRQWSRERSEESRERSVDSRDSATRERDLRYAEERKRDRERGRREEVVLYCHSDSESVHRNSESGHSDSESIESDTTEEGELKSPKRRRKRSPVSTPTVVDETTTSWETPPQSAVAGSHTFVEKTEHSAEQDIQPKAAKDPLVSKEATRRTELDTELTRDSCAASKRSVAADDKKSDDNHCKTSRNGAKCARLEDDHEPGQVSDETSDSDEEEEDKTRRRDRKKGRKRDSDGDRKRDSDHDRKRDPDHDRSRRGGGDRDWQRDSDHHRRHDRDYDRRRDSDRDRDRRDDQGHRGDRYRRDGHDRHQRKNDSDESHRDDRDHNERDDKERSGAPREDRKRKSGDDGEVDDRHKVARRDALEAERAPKEEGPEAARKKDVITGRTGGAYIPPARLRLMQAQITDKSSAEYQRIAWEALKKSINGLVNKANTANIDVIIRELMRENLVRGRGLLSRTIITAQAASPTFTHVYAALVAVINTKFPQTGELILKRLVIQLQRAYRRNDKGACTSALRFIAHLLNQQVAHELLALEVITLLLGNPTNDAVEVAVGFIKECGMKLTELSPKGVHAVFERLRSILHEANLDKRVQYMIEVVFAVRKDGFSAHPSVVKELELVEEEQQYTHLLSLDDKLDGEEILNVFKFDPDFAENEARYAEIAKDILGSDDEADGSEGDDSEDDEEEEAQADENGEIIDTTETNLVALRRTIYLTIQSSLNFEECAHKLLKLELKPGQVNEMCHMILDCCAQQRTYEKFYGLLAQRFCQLKKEYAEPFEQIFLSSYDTIHRFETNKLRNVAKFFAHLLFTDAIPWNVLSHIKLTEDDTTSSSRIFIKILFQELCEYMSLPKLNERIKDVTLQDAFDGLFPRNLPKNTRFAINFFTSIGLGGLTADLREHLKTAPKVVPVPETIIAAAPATKKDASSSSDSSSDSSTETSSSSSSSSDKHTHSSRKKKNKKGKKHRRSAKASKKQKTHSSDGKNGCEQGKRHVPEEVSKGALERPEVHSSHKGRHAEHGIQLQHTGSDSKHSGVHETKQAEKRGDLDHRLQDKKPEGRAKNKRQPGSGGRMEEAGSNARGDRDNSARERHSSSSRHSRRNH